jgi:hypothetical protein
VIVRIFWQAVVFTASGIVAVSDFPALAASEESPAPELKPVDPPKAADLRSQISAGLREVFPATPIARRQQAEKLVVLYRQTSAAKDISAAERARLQARLKSRLTRLAEAISRDVSQARTASQATKAVESTAGSTAPPVSPRAAGGAPQDDGQALVELIQTTIAPSSWDVNGGRGTIYYWPAWHVLVVRQTDDVHEQIGGVMHAMRK